MDARITKERLSNLLSYDWLKILAAVAAAVLVLSVLFTSLATRPTLAQSYEIFGYTDLSYGSDYAELGDRLENKKAFSYDILTVTVESFGTSSYGSTVYAARRMAGQGDAMFISDYEVYGTNEETGEEELTKASELKTFIETYSESVLDTQVFLSDAANYLDGFFGGDWETGELDEEAVAKAFTARNDSDKRFKTEASKLAGIEQEKERVLKLRDDLKAVNDALARGVISHTVIEGAGTDGADKACAFRVGGAQMRGLTDLFYYEADKDGTTVRSSETLSLMLFDNGNASGDLVYDTLSFLHYLLDTYEGTQA